MNINITTGDTIFSKPTEIIGRINFNIQYENEGFILNLVHKNYEQKITLSSLPCSSTKSILDLFKVKSTPCLQLIGVGLTLAKKLQMNDDHVVEQLHTIYNENIKEGSIVAHFVNLDLPQNTVDSLLDNNCLNLVSLNHNNQTFNKYYVPYTPPLRFITDVSQETKELWDKIKISMRIKCSI